MLTLGDLRLQTLELPWKDNHPLTSCIPVGEYRLKILPSVRFSRLMPRVLDVPGRSGILIHFGNVEKDTHGCILVGLERGKDGASVVSSRSAFLILYDALSSSQEPGQIERLSISYADEPDGVPRQFETP